MIKRTSKKNMSLKSKLALVYILAGFLPVFVILIVNFVQMRKMFKDKEISAFKTYVNQAVNSLDNQIRIYNNLSDYVSCDYMISDVLGMNYRSQDDFCNSFDEQVSPILSSLKYLHDEIKTITIYTDKTDTEHGEYLIPLSKGQGEDWYKLIKNKSDNHWYIDSKSAKAILARKIDMPDNVNSTAILCIEVNYSKMVEPFQEKTNDNYGLYVASMKNEMVFGYNGYDSENTKYELSFNEVVKRSLSQNSDYTIISKKSQTTDWVVWLYKPNALMNTTLNSVITITASGIGICMAAAFLCIRFTAIFVTKRIEKLQKAIALVEKEDFSVEIYSKSNDEIGDLMKSFSRMEKKLNHLINEVYKSKLNEKEYEMKALQAQINPHFLYNTLSLINWKAIEARQKDISKITLDLSAFYRTSLNKGKNVIELSGEIENMRSYLSIQLMLHDNSFDVVEDIDSSVLKYKTLNLILQPLIENAIDHGIDVLEDDIRGVITISAKEKDNLIVLSVKDNGIGMDKEQASKILTSESKGYGVRNVNERLKLYYGENYPLIINSDIGHGTEVIISFPKVF